MPGRHPAVTGATLGHSGLATGVAGVAGRRGLAYAVLLGLAGGGLALYAATRTWAVEVWPRPPLPPREVPYTGGQLLPWLPALAVVALAGAAAVLATQGLVRRVVGVLLLLVSAAVVAGGGYPLLAQDDIGPGWPALCLVGGLVAAAGAAMTARHGHQWPVMGARYERGTTRSTGAPAPDGGRVGLGNTREAWDALDRGEDPTVN